jgi:hypothetical protein
MTEVQVMAASQGVGLTLKFVADGLRDGSVREQSCQQTQ